MRLPRMRFVRPIVVTLALLSCTENGPVGPQLNTSARLNASGSSQSVVISQVYGGGGNSGATIKNDFIEIFNNGNDAVNLTGWSLQYGSSAGNFNSSPNVPTPLSGTLAPGQYLLVQEAAGTGGTVSLSADIVAPTPIAMSASDAKVALVRSGTLTCGATATPCSAAQLTQVADLVGYGSANLFEGTAAVGTLSATLGASRNGSGCTDTDKNSLDFTRVAPSPRNRASALNVCGGVVVPVDHITVAPVPPATGTVAVGASVQFKATVFDASNNDISGSNPVTWSTSPTGFATVDATGLATGSAVGNTTVVATAGGKSGSAALTVTPAAPVDNGDIVISQIYGGGGNSGATYTNDYIEILNKGDNAVNLAGWSVQYGSPSGSSFQAHALSGTVQPGHYFLIQESSNAAVGAPLPAADLSDGLNLGGTAGKVILAKTTIAQTTACPVGSLIVDMVAYGSGTNCADAANWKGATPATSSQNAAFRRGDGCTNTGNAANDFTVAAATPRNSASPQKRCAVVTPPPSVHFSELHYDNSGTDVNEKIEIAGPAGTDLTGWSVVLYGGDATPTFSAYSTTDLGVTIPATCGANGVIVVDYGVNGIKNAKFNATGNPAGMALIDNNGQVVEFLSYEGTFTALDGPAAGHLSVDMGVAEEPPPAAGNSLHRDDLGVWQPAAPQDFGACNTVNATPPPATNTITFTGRLATDQPLPVGFEDQLFASEKNASGVTVTGATFTWLALTPAIATIDADGVMHAVSAGTATFQATAGDGTVATYSLQMASLSFSTSADWSGNLEFGTPTDNTPADDHIITHDQFTSSYSYEKNTPNWVSAKIDASHYGSGSDRCDCFTFDPAVPSNLYFTTNAYTGVGSTWNRGHLLRSADVEATPSDNAIAYYFSNIAPQSAQMNQGPWAVEENFIGDLAKNGGKDVYEIMGVSGSQGTLKGIVGAPVIPQWFWKVAVIVPHGTKLADIHRDDDLQVIAVLMPNVANVNADWTTYKTTVDAIEALSGYDLLNALPLDIQAVVESNDRPPVPVMAGPTTGDEGSALSFSGSGSSDPDGDALTYSWNFGDNTTATGVSPTHVFTDNGQYIVTLTVTDAIGAKRSTTQVVTVSNLAPSGTFSSPAAVTEGSTFSISIDNATDPSSADVAAGFSYRFDCGTGFGGWTSSSSFSCSATDNPGASLAAEVKDKDGAVAHYSGAVVIDNVAPTAVFSNNGPVNEGQSFTISLSGANDVSSADVAAGFQYRFDCGTGFGDWSSTSSASCTAPNHGTYNVGGEIRDKDLGVSSYTGTATVNNLAPTGVFLYTGSVNEGSPFTLVINNGTDSPADVAAGFQYRFDCGTGSGMGAWGTANSVSCPTTDNGSPTAVGEIRDHDGAISSYSGTVTVNNVTPSVQVDPAGTITSGTTFHIAAGFMDAGLNDGPWTYIINWGDGSSTGSTNVEGAIAGAHQYFVAGSYSITMTVTDKDGATGSASTTLQVARVAGSMGVNPNSVNIGNNGNGTVTVTVFGTSQFSAGAITTSSVRIGHTAPDTQGNGSLKLSVSDVNHDGILDMVAQFQRSALVANGDITGSSTQLSLDATLADGRQIRATGAVSVNN